MKLIRTMTIVALAGSIMGAHAGLVSATRSTDNVLQGNFETGASDVFLTNNSNARRVGSGGASDDQRVNHPVLGFNLPSLGAGESVSAVTFSFTMDTTALNGTPPDMVISLMHQTAVTGFSAADFIEGTAAINNTQGNGTVIGYLSTSDVENDSVESFTLTGAALTQFAGLYDASGNPSQSEVWFRLSTSEAMDTSVSTGTNVRFNMARNDTGDGLLVTRSLNITTIPEPATMGLFSIFGAGALFIRRRFML